MKLFKQFNLFKPLNCLKRKHGWHRDIYERAEKARYLINREVTAIITLREGLEFSRVDISDGAVLGGLRVCDWAAV